MWIVLLLSMDYIYLLKQANVNILGSFSVKESIHIFGRKLSYYILSYICTDDLKALQML